MMKVFIITCVALILSFRATAEEVKELSGEQINKLAAQLITENSIRIDRAREIYESWQEDK